MWDNKSVKFTVGPKLSWLVKGMEETDGEILQMDLNLFGGVGGGEKRQRAVLPFTVKLVLCNDVIKKHCLQRKKIRKEKPGNCNQRPVGAELGQQVTQMPLL